MFALEAAGSIRIHLGIKSVISVAFRWPYRNPLRNRPGQIYDLIDIDANCIGNTSFELCLKYKALARIGRSLDAPPEFLRVDNLLALGVDNHNETVESCSSLLSGSACAGAYLRVISAQNSPNSFGSLGGDV